MNNEKKPPRVFVGIKIPPDISGEILRRAEPLRGSPVKIIPPEDIHITLLPPWDAADVSMIMEKVRGVVREIESFPITFNRLCYGPTLMKPWLLWAECAATPQLVGLKKALVESFRHFDKIPFHPHATIARFRNGKTANTSITHEYPIDEKISLVHRVESIQLFQSPHQDGSGYRVLKSFMLRTGLGIPH